MGARAEADQQAAFADIQKRAVDGRGQSGGHRR